MFIIYSLPFFILSILTVIVFRSWFNSIDGTVGFLLGMIMGVMSLILGTIIELWRNR